MKSTRLKQACESLSVSPVVPIDAKETVFSKEELIALGEAIKKSRSKALDIKSQSCAYHR